MKRSQRNDGMCKVTPNCGNLDAIKWKKVAHSTGRMEYWSVGVAELDEQLITKLYDHFPQKTIKHFERHYEKTKRSRIL